MKTEIQISIVIACYNQSVELELTLASFLQQSLDQRLYELIVVDDHSPDTTARDVVAQARIRYPEAQLFYIRNWRGDGGHYGASATVKNVGIRLSRGAIVYFNNAEIVQAGESLRYIIDNMNLSPEPMCLRGIVLDLPLEDLVGTTPHSREIIHDRTSRDRERVATADHAGLAAVSRKILIAVGGIDERFDYWGKEDIDLAARLKRVGVSYRYDPMIKSFHIAHSKNHIKDGDYRRMCALLDENNAASCIEVNLSKAWGTLGRLNSALQTTIAIEVEGKWSCDRVARVLEEIQYGPHTERCEPVLVCPESERRDLENWLDARWPHLAVVAYQTDDTATLMRRLVRNCHSERIAWLPTDVDLCALDAVEGLGKATSFSPWIAATDAPEKSAKLHPVAACGWFASRNGIQIAEDWGLPSTWKMRPFTNAVTTIDGIPSWAAPMVCHPEKSDFSEAESAPAIGFRSSVMVTIPHYQCEGWLLRCLHSIVEQTRAPQAIAVLHDGAELPPIDIVKQFPEVSLYQSDVKVGPYALVQSLIDSTSFDAVLFQDADDWSARQRLELLLAEAERTGAELVGSQEIRVDEIAKRVHAVCYPQNVSHALSLSPGHSLLHPTSLISTRLLRRLGGFATGLRFGADTELLLRAGFAGRIVNIPEGTYFRRHRQNSLTTSPETGLHSPARIALLNELKNRALHNKRLCENGQLPALRPHAERRPVQLVHLVGPALIPRI